MVLFLIESIHTYDANTLRFQQCENFSGKKLITSYNDNIITLSWYYDNFIMINHIIMMPLLC
jgi:hypothetical protein